MARNLSWIDKRRLSALLDETGTPSEEERGFGDEVDPLVPRPDEREARARFREPQAPPPAPPPLHEPPEPPPALFAEAIDALNIEAFATSGPSSFDLPKTEQETHSREPADPVVDDALQFSPFETGTNAPVSEEGPEDFFPSPPPMSPSVEVVAPSIDLNDEELTAVWDQQAQANEALSLPPERTQETPSGAHDDLAMSSLGPVSAGPVEDILAQARQRLTPQLPAPPFVDDEPVELTAERFFDWALDLSGLDGALVVDKDGLTIAERGFHELPPALLAELAPLSAGVERYLDARDCGAIQFRHQRLAVVFIWARHEGRALYAGFSGLAEPNPGVSAIADGFRALFFGARSLSANIDSGAPHEQT